jgi:hypothetical protein
LFLRLSNGASIDEKNFDNRLQVFKETLLNFEFYNSSVTFTIERQTVMAGVIITFFASFCCACAPNGYQPYAK